MEYNHKVIIIWLTIPDAIIENYWTHSHTLMSNMFRCVDWKLENTWLPVNVEQSYSASACFSSPLLLACALCMCWLGLGLLMTQHSSWRVQAATHLFFRDPACNVPWRLICLSLSVCTLVLISPWFSVCSELLA